ncbi:MAG: DUF3256 family protein [Tannerellaceae bacterium]|jgi:hypothetical protein|nr:DUF3256 family protein [Tannerellaceae bacterium]
MRRYVYVLILCVCVLGVKAQDMKAVFIAMPDRYIPQLESAWRKDLVDLYGSGKEARLKNTMNGYSQLMKMTGDYLLLQTTERSVVEMKLLPLVNNTCIICMITTVSAPAPDSRIDFYTTGWEPLTVSDLIVPVSADWFIKEDADRNSDACKDAMAHLDMDLISYRLSPDNQTLEAVYTTPLYLNAEQRAQASPFLKDTPKVYTWDKFRFK